jgi:chaperonin cofactor prefoldin
MFANTVFSTIYQSIARLINPSHKAYTQELERKISLLNNRIDFLESDNFDLNEQKLESREEINFLNRYLGEWHEEARNLNNKIDDLIQENTDLKSVNKLISRELSALGNDELKNENKALKQKIDQLEEQIDDFIDDGVMAQMEEQCGCNSNIITIDANEHERLLADREELTKAQDKITSLEIDNQCLNFMLLEQQENANIDSDLQKENESLKRDFWDLAKSHNQLKNDYDELKKHDDWLNDMLLDGSELVTGIDAPIVEHDTLKVAAI